MPRSSKPSAESDRLCLGSLEAYFAKIGEIDLLTKEQEIELGRKVRLMMDLFRWRGRKILEARQQGRNPEPHPFWDEADFSYRSKIEEALDQERKDPSAQPKKPNARAKKSIKPSASFPKDEKPSGKAKKLKGRSRKSVKPSKALLKKDLHPTYLKEIISRGFSAGEKMIKANQKFVVSMAKRYWRFNKRIDLIDLIQEGNIGLMKAVERFDPERGFKFSTYAGWWIRHAIGRAIADKSRTIRIPVHLLALARKVNKTEKELFGKLGRDPTIEELADATGFTIKKILSALDASYLNSRIRSIAEYPGQDEEGSDSLQVADPSSEDVLESMDREKELRSAMSLMRQLPDFQQDILNRRFGLDGHPEATLEEIGEGYSLSRERIRQLQVRALGDLRAKMQESGIGQKLAC